MKRPVWRKRVKITGLVLSIMMLGVWLFSVMFRSRYVPPSRNCTFVIGSGQILFANRQSGSQGWSCDPRYLSVRYAVATKSWTTLSHDYLGFRLPRKTAIVSVLPGKTAYVFIVPAWLLVVAAGFPTAVLWWRDRRLKPGLCMVCKYDLTGNVSGICPECGTSLAPEEAP